MWVRLFPKNPQFLPNLYGTSPKKILMSVLFWQILINLTHIVLIWIVILNIYSASNACKLKLWKPYFQNWNLKVVLAAWIAQSISAFSSIKNPYNSQFLKNMSSLLDFPIMQCNVLQKKFSQEKQKFLLH